MSSSSPSSNSRNVKILFIVHRSCRCELDHNEVFSSSTNKHTINNWMLIKYLTNNGLKNFFSRASSFCLSTNCLTWSLRVYLKFCASMCVSQVSGSNIKKIVVNVEREAKNKYHRSCTMDIDLVSSSEIDSVNGKFHGQFAFQVVFK